MNGATFTQQNTAARAASRAGGYRKLTTILGMRDSKPATATNDAGQAPSGRITMKVTVGEDGKRRIEQVVTT
ncbi:hypothetical protein [Brevundimonas mediterranea]|uniref:hypothetical protein n=1 Tax=Brevundimonas mediterranea TaxID=74329 RepID=UPI004033C158